MADQKVAGTAGDGERKRRKRSRGDAPKLSGDYRVEWDREHEFDLLHYGQFGDIGPHSANLDPDVNPGNQTEQKAPQYRYGADLYTILTVEERLQAADKLMPVADVDGWIRPSASQILRTRYGDRGFKWDDSAPTGSGEWLVDAQVAYCVAARGVARRKAKTLLEVVEGHYQASQGDDDD